MLTHCPRAIFREPLEILVVEVDCYVLKGGIGIKFHQLIKRLRLVSFCPRCNELSLSRFCCLNYLFPGGEKSIQLPGSYLSQSVQFSPELCRANRPFQMLLT